MNIEDSEEVHHTDYDDNWEILIEVNIPGDEITSVADGEDEGPELGRIEEVADIWRFGSWEEGEWTTYGICRGQLL